MTSSCRFRVNSPRVIEETIESEVIIADLSRGFYYSLDNVGAAVWNALVKGMTISEIVDTVVRRCNAIRLEVEDGINELIAQLQQEALIIPDPSESSPTDTAKAVLSESTPMSFERPTLNKYTDMEQLLLLDPIHEVDETGWPNVDSNTPKTDG